MQALAMPRTLLLHPVDDDHASERHHRPLVRAQRGIRRGIGRVQSAGRGWPSRPGRDRDDERSGNLDTSREAMPNLLGTLSPAGYGPIRTPGPGHRAPPERHGKDRQRRPQERSPCHLMTLGPGRSVRKTLNWVGEPVESRRRGDARSTGTTPAAGAGNRVSGGADHQRRQHHSQRRTPDARPGPARHVESACGHPHAHRTFG